MTGDQLHRAGVTGCHLHSLCSERVFTLAHLNTHSSAEELRSSNSHPQQLWFIQFYIICLATVCFCVLDSWEKETDTFACAQWMEIAVLYPRGIFPISCSAPFWYNFRATTQHSICVLLIKAGVNFLFNSRNLNSINQLKNAKLIFSICEMHIN